MAGKERKDWSEWSDWVREQDDPRVAHTKLEALDDIVVLDLSSKSFAGCHCSSALAEYGAHVIRVEPPGGDFIRTCTPYGFMYKGSQ
jgi:crotonobetainyl-CoA:carnitine CoA-transferase CaiB-like acyl-CoA transferase